MKRPVMAVQSAGGHAMAQNLLAAQTAAEALRDNIREEQELYNQFLMAVRTIITPIQAATAIVQVSLGSGMILYAL
jgi:hypothetical protein